MLITNKNSIDKMFKEMKRDRKNHPVYYFFHDLYWGFRRSFGETRRYIVRFIQRGKRGWGNSDTWGLDYYLAKTISETVHHLKEYVHGMPNELTEGQWIDILNEISYGFELAKRMSEGELYLIRDTKQKESWQKTLDELNKEYEANDRCMTSKEIKAYERGWKLFKEYFFNLWD